MSNEQLEKLEQLARRAVACKRWRWMPGMMTCGGWRVIAISEGRSVCAKYDFVVISPEHDAIPDLTDPATIGCLFALVREAYGQPTMSCLFDHADATWSEYPWDVKLVGVRVVIGGCGPTEAAALVAALEAAP
jgi:hypothetical protein